MALGSYTLALLLRRLLFLQRHLRAAQVLQPTAIRAPGRHTREVCECVCECVRLYACMHAREFVVRVRAEGRSP